MIPISIVAFTLIGVLAMYFPEILGNGKAGNELTFTNDITWTYALGLFGSKWVAVLLALAAGAYGGRMGYCYSANIFGDVCFCGGRSILRPCTKNAYDILCIYA